MPKIGPGHPIGHYYSPINDTSLLDRETMEARRKTISAGDVKGIALDENRFVSMWHDFAKSAEDFPFSREKQDNFRYFYGNNFYGIGDAFFHFSIVKHFKPKRYIEIGSGFSSACFLDTAQHIGLNVDCTFVEPYQDRLRSLLNSKDLSTHHFIEQPAQRTSPSIYGALAANDILFIDSSHVSKSDSDVNFELFEILPSLASGVVVHFHDIFWPFEYPSRWIFDEKFSWNELYAVRAFLSFNSDFEILFFNDYFCARHDQLIQSTKLPEDLRVLRLSCGGGLWIRRK